MQSEEYTYSAMGKLVVAFQSLDKAIDQLMFCSMTLDYNQFSVLAAELAFKTKVNVSCALLKQLHHENEEITDHGNIYALTDEIRKDCFKCEERRNQIVHSSWIPKFKSAPDLVLRTKSSSKSKKGYKHTVETIKPGSLDPDIELIESTGEKVRDVCQTLASQFNRIHGMVGLAGEISHEALIEMIYSNFMSKYGEAKEEAT